jgi:hypothetical protein
MELLVVILAQLPVEGFLGIITDFLCAFAEPLGIATSFFAELRGALKAIEIAFSNNWNHLWLETDSMLVVNAFKNQNKIVAWPLRNRWKNALAVTRQMNFLISRVYREGNKVADLMANFGLTLSSFTSLHVAPLFIYDILMSNKLGFALVNGVLVWSPLFVIFSLLSNIFWCG